MRIKGRAVATLLLLHLFALATNCVAGTTSFTHDSNGNRTSKTLDGRTTVYRWNLQGRLVEVLQDGTWVARYAYDSDGRRVEKLVNGAPTPRLTRYVWDGDHVIREVNAVGNTLATYEWHGNRLLTAKRGGQRYYYLHDALGSVIFESTADGGAFARYGYDAWGNPTRTYGNSSNPHLFTGHPFDDETGLHYANQRYYDAFSGGFISVDPAAGEFTATEPVTFHPYAYARANPLIYLDPDGRTAELQQVLTGFERNRKSVVRMADQLKMVRPHLNWLERQFIDMGIAGAAVLNAANYVGEGVTFTANAGANAALSFTDNYIADLGRGADASNRELKELYDAAAPAAVKAWENPTQAATQAGVAVINPYVRAYEGDTGAQLDVLANLDPRRISKRIFKAVSDPDAPHASSSEAYVVVEEPSGNAAFRPQQPSVSADFQPACFGSSCTTNYRGTFFDANPELRGQVVVHHAVEQQVARDHPNLVQPGEMHSLENLRGIPKDRNNDLHLSKIRVEWNRFYRTNPNPTREQLLQKATEIDSKFGHEFLPPVRNAPEAQ